MDKWTDEEIKGKILFKLTRIGKFKHSHTALNNLPKGFPREMRGYVKNIVDKLISERILLVKQTSYGKEVSLNDNKLDLIQHYVDCFASRIS